MKLFTRKRKYETIGKPPEKIITVTKNCPALNYTPLDYEYSRTYAAFLSNSEQFFRKIINSTDPDDLNDSMLDGYIDAQINEMKASAASQNSHHLRFINHIRGIINGQHASAESICKNLRADLENIDKELKRYRTIKENLNILS